MGPRSIIDEHEIVPGTVHFRKPKHNRSLTYALLLRKYAKRPALPSLLSFINP